MQCYMFSVIQIIRDHKCHPEVISGHVYPGRLRITSNKQYEDSFPFSNHQPHDFTWK